MRERTAHLTKDGERSKVGVEKEKRQEKYEELELEVWLLAF